MRLKIEARWDVITWLGWTCDQICMELGKGGQNVHPNREPTLMPCLAHTEWKEQNE